MADDLSKLGFVPEEEYQKLGFIPEEQAASQAAPEAPVDASSDLDAALAGGAQGLTMGFSDELGAAGDVASDVLSGGGLEGLGSKWRSYQKTREAANKALEEAHPKSYLAGEIGGGLLGVPLMPELGGAKLVGAAGKLSPKVAAFLAGKTPEAIAIMDALKAGKLAPEAAEAALAAAPKAGLVSKIAGKATASAIEGAPVGALYGLGSSKSDIEHPDQLVSDAASGAAMGSLGGLAIGTAIGGAKAAAEGIPALANKFDFTRKLGEAYKMGKEGLNFGSSEGKSKVAKMAKDIPNKVTNDILEADKVLGQAVGESLNKAEQAGVRINIDPQLKTSSQELFQTFAENPALLQTVDPKSKALIMKVSQEGLGDLSPIEARALKDTFQDLTDKLQGLTSDVASLARQKGMSLSSSLDEALKTQIPEYKAAAQKFAEFRSSIPEVALQPGLPADKRTKMLGSLKHKDTELYKGVRDVLEGARQPGASVTEGPRAGLEEMLSNLQKLQRSSPEAVAKLGGKAPDVAKQWGTLADRMAILRQSQGVEPREGLKRTLWGQVVGAGEGVGYNIAGKAGQISESAPVKASKKLFALPDEKLLQIAQGLKGSNASAWYGEALEKAVMNKSDAGKNAVLFKLLQIPEYRNMLSQSGEE